MKKRGLSDRYDCVAMHPYTNFSRDFGVAWKSAAEAHDQMMLGDEWAQTMVRRLADDVKANASPGPDGRAPFLTISEMGALFFGSDALSTASFTVVPTANYNMSHSLYMASQWVEYARLRLGWVEGNTLVAEPNGLRGALGGRATGFVYGAEAMTREALGPAFATGSTWVGSKMSAPEMVTAVGAIEGTYPALVVGATTSSDGALRVVVVNRRRSLPSVARVSPAGFERGAAVEVTTVRGSSFESAMDGASGPGDDSVTIARTTETFDTAAFSYSFAPASLTVLTLRAPCP